MWEEMLNVAVSNGIWAVMFCSLLVYQLKDSRKRENKYVRLIDELTANLSIIKQIKEGTDEVKQILVSTRLRGKSA